MNIKTFYVPRGIKYMSQWKNYEIPSGEHCIVDKGVTGCGYTELVLTNSENMVLCSPRKLLLENKSRKHENLEDFNIFYLENNIKNFSDVQNFYAMIDTLLSECWGEEINQPAKFMITYDSLHYLVSYFKDRDILGEFKFVVDEFQSIFSDAFFKADVEFDFVQELQNCQSVVYLSATPALDEYLKEVPEFANLDFYKLDWSETGYVENVKIQRKRVRSFPEEIDKIIKRYRSGIYETEVDVNGNLVESKEAVFYFNSVTDIIRTATRNNLTPEDTRIICSDTPENRRKLKRIGFKPEKIPLEGEDNSEFMLCTATTYFGVDMHSSCASSYVFADPNIDSLALDISLDLPQIAGRQRNRENPFKNILTVFYKTTREEITREEFEEDLDLKIKESNNVLEGFKNLTKEQQSTYLSKIQDSIKVSKYSRDFIGISKSTHLPVYNKFIELARKRAWEVSQVDYQDSIMVTRAIQKAGYDNIVEFSDNDEKISKEFLDDHFYKTGIFREKMKMYCEFMDTYQENHHLIDLVNSKIPDHNFEKYYKFYGTKGCSSRSYQKSLLESGFISLSKTDELTSRIQSAFMVGERYSKAYIKRLLQGIYDSLGIVKRAKASDIEKYFNISRTNLSINGTISNGFKLINIL